MTGAPLPDGADCVIRIEHTERHDDHVIVVNALDAGRNVRVRGEDMKTGDVVLRSGQYLRAGEIGLLATVGKSEVNVFRRPAVAILSTGDELAEFADFAEVIAGRKIANSNSYALAAAVSATGAVPHVLGIAKDERNSLSEHLDRALDSDVLITTAGASVGDHDLVKDVLEQRGFVLNFWRVRMRPGSPFSFGFLHTNERQIPVFGLPGNPVSALVTCELFVRPALRRLQGRSALFSPTERVRVAGHTGSKSGLAHFLRVRLRRGADGVLEARLTGAQGSGLITSMAYADGLLVVPEDRDGLAEGEIAWAIRLAPGDEAQDSIGF
jgi:molybdopterin molybdotransferase